MNDLVTQYGIPPEKFKRGRRLKIVAWTAPVVFAFIPALVFLVLSLLLSGTTVFALSLFVGLIVTVIGFLFGLIVSGISVYRHTQWTSEMRERIAATGIRAREIDWFRNELKSSEKRALKAVESADELLADAYRETLASRLTASRIIRSSRKELEATKRRRSKLKQLKSERAETFKDEIDKDFLNISKIHAQAKEMLTESESRLQMIEAAASRGSKLSGHEVALKKLSIRTADLPPALEEARLTREIKIDIDKELEMAELEEDLSQK